MFAVVAVNAPAHGGGTAYRETALAGEEGILPGPVFHYHVPPRLQGQVIPGALIEVPFGTRRVQGVVVALSDAAPVQETKPVARLLLDEPVLSPAQIDLGLWLSKYYVSALIECFRLMLPPGLLRRPRTTFHLHPEVPVPADLPPAQRKAVEWVQRYGTLSAAQIARRLGKRETRQALRALVRRGILVKGSDLPAPRARPKRVNFVRLSASPPQAAAARPMLGRPSGQADVLQALLEEDDPLPPAGRILARADVSRSTLATLARKGWIDVNPERTLILAAPAASSAELGRAPRQRAVLEYLQERGVPIAEHELRRTAGASASVLRSLREREAIQEIVEPATVILRLDAREARQQIVALRGAENQHRVLDYLLARPPGEWLWVSWVYAETACGLNDLRALEGHGLVELAEREVWRDPLADRSFVLETAPPLTPDQAEAWSAIEPHLLRAHESAASRPAPGTPSLRPSLVFLLHGVTGSGKTEIYMRAAEATLRLGRRVIILVPEISLTPQTVRRFSARFPDGLGIIHSGLSDGERYDTWRRIRAGQIRLVIGPRSALFAPMDDIGLIVLDEEHASAYKETDSMPSYHARAVATQIALAQHAVLILGSATPDLVTYYQALETGQVQLLELPQRILKHRRDLENQQAQLDPSRVKYRPLAPGLKDVYAIDLPPVRIVDMRHELRVGTRSIFSRALQAEVEKCLANGEQAILFLNRRGASTFVMCRDCGTVSRCPHCDIPLTYHLKSKRLTCHHCNYQRPEPRVCPICQSHRIKYFGVGTQRVEQAVHESWPHARIMRWDYDAVTGHETHQALLDRFASQQADVLIGTQMVAKGLDLPLVTLVGVVSADTALCLPDFRASERTFQLLAQVAGRAGRGPRGGQVIIQTYTPEHYAIRSAAQHDYAAFFAQERAFRSQMGYPPFSHLARLVGSNSNLARCREEAQELAHLLRARIQHDRLDGLSIIGPAPCFFSRLRGNWRWHILVRAPLEGDGLHALLGHLSIPPGWKLDIDPLEIL
jgi:primosomal protein N' (replication factor Y)